MHFTRWSCSRTHRFSEFLPWVMTPVNSTSLWASTSNQWFFSSGSAHHAPPYRSSSLSEPCRRSQAWSLTFPVLIADLLFSPMTCYINMELLCVYLHVEASPLGCEAVVRLRGSQQLVVLYPVRLHTQRRTYWEEKQNITDTHKEDLFDTNSKHSLTSLLGAKLQQLTSLSKAFFLFNKDRCCKTSPKDSVVVLKGLMD